MLTRLFGEDGLRGTGARLGWLVPVPWFRRSMPASKNAKGETQVSSCGNDEVVFAERSIRGPAFGTARVRSWRNFTYLVRLVERNRSLGHDQRPARRVRRVFGPNGTGNSGRTQLSVRTWS